MDRNKEAPVARRDGGEGVAAFVEAARGVPAPGSSGRGRLIFALDATLSRQPTWDLAQALQAKMFQTASGLGGLEVQLVYYRGFNECRASKFVSGGQGLAELMSRIGVRGGETQIRKVLAHARNEAKQAKVAALVFVGDAMEESPDELAGLAGELALLGRQGLHVPGRAGPFGATDIFRHRSPDRRRLQRLRCRRRGAARGASARRRGLRRRRPRRARPRGGG